MLMNNHLSRFMLINALKASITGGTSIFDSLTKELLKIDHGILDNVLLSLNALAHNLLCVVFEDLREVVRHENLLSREYTHLSNVRHYFIFSKLFIIIFKNVVLNYKTYRFNKLKMQSDFINPYQQHRMQPTLPKNRPTLIS